MNWAEFQNQKVIRWRAPRENARQWAGSGYTG
jgi:hypothetical protein